MLCVCVFVCLAFFFASVCYFPVFVLVALEMV